MHDVKAYLARPYRFQSGVYNYVTPGLAFATTILSSTFPDLIGRCKGAYGIRATIVYRFQIAATPFQAGVVRVVWQPQTVANGLTPPRDLTRTAVSQLPGVNLDICEQTSVILRVPFVSSWNYYPILGDNGATREFYATTPYVWGTISVFSYLPLTLASGATNPTYATFIHLEDVELVGAVCTGLTSVIPQAGNEQRMIDKPVSVMLAAASRVVALYGGYVPLISSYSTTTSWMLRMGAKLASSFGWSKPLDVSTIQRVTPTFNTYQMNSDGFDVSYNLGVFSDNEVAALPGFAGTNLDEMSFDYILSVPTCICAGNFTTTDTVDQTKYALAVCPGSCWFNTNSGGAMNGPVTPSPSIASPLAILPSPLFFLGNTHSYWQGVIRVTVRIAKTKFHTGRVLLAFNPCVTAVGNPGACFVPTSYRDLQFKSLIWDLRESNVITFDVPYVSPYSYNLIRQPTGVFTISIIDPLVAPSTVSSSVPFVIEVSALPGFQFVAPVTPYLCPAPLSGTTIYSQSGDTIYNDVSVSDPMTCAGERVISIKQLISRSCVDFQTNTGETTAAPFFSYDYPIWTGTANLNLGAGSTNPLSFCRYFSTMFAYARGSTAHDAMNVNQVGLIFSRFVGSLQFNDIVEGLDVNYCSNSIVVEKDALHIHVPFYSPNSRVATNTAGIWPFTAGIAPTSGASFGTAGGAKITVCTRAADDAQLGYFLGVPPLATRPPDAFDQTFKTYYYS